MPDLADCNIVGHMPRVDPENLGFTTTTCVIFVTTNKYLPYKRNVECTIVNYIPNNKLKFSVHISQKYGEF